MSITKKVFDAADRLVHFDVAYAHCDIPCGIYDPHAAQVAAHTVIRMDMFIADIMKSGGVSAEDRNRLVRCIEVKEQHAELCKHEIEVLWGDYFKPEHVKANPGLHELVWNTLKAAGKAKQSTDIKDAESLLADVEKIAEIFWKTKGVETKRVKSFYPTEREFVYPRV
ncbi:MAG: superoxide dismutase, Ni [Candidatus Marsarchaeota archaeon]|jgi:nickel superoxide dismutase|nr:superoxide dismutase, Ni [Candidatus Marsarchaeota archaeon]